MDDGCRQVLQHLQRFLDCELDGDLEVEITRHIRGCPPCIDRADFERELRVIIATRSRIQAPRGLADRIVMRLREGEPS